MLQLQTDIAAHLDASWVAARVCLDLGLGEGVLTGADVDDLDDIALATAITTTTVFARISRPRSSPRWRGWSSAISS